jgi:hypothetical protein
MDNPFRTTGLRHGQGDPRGLRERIQAQLTERIEEAVEMAALHLLVELRTHEGRAAPETDSRADRDEFAALATDLLRYLGQAFEQELGPEQRRDLDRARAEGADPRARELHGQVFLSSRLPDYWQRFEAQRAAHAAARLTSPARPVGLLKRLFG